MPGYKIRIGELVSIVKQWEYLQDLKEVRRIPCECIRAAEGVTKWKVFQKQMP